MCIRDSIYAALIIKGKKSINDVPDKIRDEVKQVLIDEGHPELAAVSYTHLDVYKRQVVQSG